MLLQHAEFTNYIRSIADVLADISMSRTVTDTEGTLTAVAFVKPIEAMEQPSGIARMS